MSHHYKTDEEVIICLLEMILDKFDLLLSCLNNGLGQGTITRILKAKWEFDSMLIVKDTQGDFGGDLKITAVDSKGAVIDSPTGLTVVFTSDKPEVLEVVQSPDNQFALTCKVGVPGQATVIANVSEGENLLFTASETFTVTAGEVASITAGKLEFPSIPA